MTKNTNMNTRFWKVVKVWFNWDKNNKNEVEIEFS